MMRDQKFFLIRTYPYPSVPVKHSGEPPDPEKVLCTLSLFSGKRFFTADDDKYD